MFLFFLGLIIMGGMECLLASLKLLLHISLHLNGATCRLSFSPTRILYFLLQSNQLHPKSNSMWRIFVPMNFIFIAQTSTYLPGQVLAADIHKFSKWQPIFVSMQTTVKPGYTWHHWSKKLLDVVAFRSVVKFTSVVNIYIYFSLFPFLFFFSYDSFLLCFGCSSFQIWKFCF